MPSVDAILGEGPTHPDPKDEIWFWRLIGTTLPIDLHLWKITILGEPDPVILKSEFVEGDLYIEIPGIRPKMAGIIQFRYDGPGEADIDCFTFIVIGVHAALDPNDDETVRRQQNECDCAGVIAETDAESIAHQYRALGLDRQPLSRRVRPEAIPLADIRPRPPIWPRRYDNPGVYPHRLGGPGEVQPLTSDQVDAMRWAAEDIQRRREEQREDAIDRQWLDRMMGGDGTGGVN